MAVTPLFEEKGVAPIAGGALCQVFCSRRDPRRASATQDGLGLQGKTYTMSEEGNWRWRVRIRAFLRHSCWPVFEFVSATMRLQKKLRELFCE